MLHHHVHLIAIVFFLVGDALHVLAQLNDLADKQKTSMLAVLKTRWVSIAVRAFISLALFVGWLDGQIDDMIAGMGITLPAWVDKLLGLQVDQGWLAALIGYAFDSALGYFPGIQKLGVPPSIDVPATPPPNAPAKG